MIQNIDSAFKESPKYVRSPETTWQQITQSRALVLSVLFFVTGELGLPLLWSSPSFTTRSKWVWSVVISLYTLMLIVGTITTVWWAYTRILSDLF